MNNWVSQAIEKIEADFKRSADTHLLKADLPFTDKIHLYLKDESTLPTGSLKHRLARSLFLYNLCNGNIKEGTVIVEASSGNTAISEAYFAKLLGLPFVAVVPVNTSIEKIEKIEFYGGQCLKVASCDIYSEAEALALKPNHHYMDQFTYAERATDWRGNNNIAESIFSQMSLEPFPVPKWIVTSAGTGGTSSTIGRFIRYQSHDTQLCVADPEHSVFYDYYQTADKSLTLTRPSAIEGIGRPRVEPSFIASVVDRMIKVPDEASFATIHFMQDKLNRMLGGSTGTNLVAAFQIIAEMHKSGEEGSVVSIICDDGHRYLETYYNADWLAANEFNLTSYQEQLERFYLK